MLLTRPKRKLMFGSITALMVALVVFGVLWPQSDVRYATFLVGWPLLSEGEKSFYTHGFTEWLVVYRRELAGAGGVPVIERHHHVNPPGLMMALGLIVTAALACGWAYRRLVHRLSLKGYCDWCGYDLTGLASGVCPECGRTLCSPPPTPIS